LTPPAPSDPTEAFRSFVREAGKNDCFVKSPSVLLGAGLRCNPVVAEGRGGSPSRPISGNPAGCPYHRICAPGIVGASGARPINGRPPDAPTIETIVWVAFYEIIKNGFEELFPKSVAGHCRRGPAYSRPSRTVCQRSPEVDGEFRRNFISFGHLAHSPRLRQRLGQPRRKRNSPRDHPAVVRKGRETLGGIFQTGSRSERRRRVHSSFLAPYDRSRRRFSNG